MNKLLIKFCLLPVAAVLLFSSCSKKIDEAFLNPNATTRVPVETLLPGIIGNFIGSSSAQGSAYGLANDGLYVGRYVQFWATNTPLNQYDRMSGATGGSDVLGSVWAMHYYGMGQNLGRMIDWAAEEEKWDYVGVGHAIRAWSWLTLTNMYGEAILRQAFDPNRLVFDYDTQEDIYAEVRRQAHLAIENLNKTGGGVSQANLALGDAYFYNGDVNKWKKFVYSVLARSFHLTNKGANYQADSVLYYCNLAINSNADNAAAKFANTGITGTSNFFGPIRGNVGVLRQTRFIADLMSGVNSMFLGVADPRAPYIIRENTNGTYKGVRPTKGPDGLATADLPQNFWGSSFALTAAPGNDNPCRYIFQNGVQFPVITAAEIAFMKAEALWLTGNKPGALTAYIDGLNLSFDFLTGTPEFHNKVPAAMQITPATRAAYLANPAVVPTAANLTLSHIMMQKYIALYGYGFMQTWVDMRRYHYTDLDPVTGMQVYADFAAPSGSDLYPDNNGKLAYRARPRYNSEYLYNVAALTSIGAIALDYHTKEQWFSQP
ncbi:MAG TPA: SusD/RagB family nutrient-binding outer membrane lipoprotein [Chitinophagaceae bacterium]|nr:SusD/RagB family nutrient-binding outer membrane lipoprotein [Chitinophagaceae bacterium]HQV85547.1 SusD/RagB family nutrient-binding outer membrane lipoprotein [Chitinophagaceae bacterium]HQZ73696.1 SusD/RagB family nutrient-binding outer membrane lipoprotein [Chitinophagaceae bacterium]